MKNTEYNSVLTRIEYFRVKKHWSRYRLAKESGIPYSSFDNLYKRNAFPSLTMLYKICNSIQISMVDFFQEELSHSSRKHMLFETIELLNEQQTEQLQLYADYLFNQTN